MNYFWSVVLEKKIIFRIVQKLKKITPNSIYKGSTLILPNCVGVYPRNIYIKCEANPCSR